MTTRSMYVFNGSTWDEVGYTIAHDVPAGGATGTVLSKSSATDYDAAWVAQSALTVAQSQVTNLTTDLSAKAPLASPTFTGVPAAPTAAVDTSTTQIATTAFTVAQIADDAVLKTVADAAGDLVVGSAADTFGRLALGTDNHVLTVDTSGSGAAKVAWEDPTANPLTVTAMAAKAPLASPTFTGTPAAPTAAVDTNTTQIATTAFIIGQGYAKIATEGWVTPIRTAGGYTAKTALYTATNDDRVINCTSGTYTVTLPTAVSQAGREFVINNSGSGVITVDGAGSETVAGAATQALSGRGRLRIVSDGANWVVLDGSYADETVGRRLFQWDANNARWQQTYSDSGLRDTAVTVANSWAIYGGYNHIRRVGNVVSLNLWLDSTSASSDTIGTIPSGFRPDRSFGLGILAPVNAIRLFQVSSAGDISADRGGITPNPGWFIQATWVTSDAWPTTLPGSAVGSIPA